MESIALTLSILHSMQDGTVFFAFLCFSQTNGNDRRADKLKPFKHFSS